jgi:hypothetical protein
VCFAKITSFSSNILRFLTFICLRRSYIPYDLGHRTSDVTPEHLCGSGGGEVNSEQKLSAVAHVIVSCYKYG